MRSVVVRVGTTAVATVEVKRVSVVLLGGDYVSSSPSHRGGVPPWAGERRGPQCLATPTERCARR